MNPADRTESSDPSPPSAIATLMISLFNSSTCEIPDEIPFSNHSEISDEVALPLNESGAITIFIYESYEYFAKVEP